MPTPSSEPRVIPAIILGASLAVLPVLLLRWVPMTDLPQHAAQLATWAALDDPTSPLHAWFRVDWRTPSLGMAVAARALHTVLPAGLAIRVLAAAAMVALPVATAILLQRSGRPPAWAWLALTLGYGYSFSWGFIAFLAGAPLVLLLLSRAVSPKDAAHPEHDPGRSTDGPDRRTSLGPDRSRAVGTLVLSSLLLMTHALLHAFALVIALPFVLRRPGTARERLLRVLPWVAPLPLGLVWAAWTWWVEPVAAEPPRLDIGWFRVPWALLSLTGQPVGTPGFVLGSAFLLAPLLLAGKLRTGWLRWWPALVTVALVLVGPSVLLGCAWLPGRWTAFLVPLLLFAVDPPAPGSRRSRGSLPACLLLAGSHLSFEVPSLLAFERDAEEFEPVLSVMAPGRRVLSIPLLAGTEWNPGAPFLHHPQWYAVEKGGIVDFSFASYYVLLVRYRREVGEVLAAGFPWHPEQFIEKARSLGPFDYYVVRAAEDPTHRLFPRGDVRLLLRSGRYFLYRPGAP